MTLRYAAGTAQIVRARRPAEKSALQGALAPRDWRWTLGMAVVAALPALIMALTIVVYGLNVPFWDDWRLAPFLRGAWTGSLSPGELWAQDSQHRLLFPRLVSIALARLTQWDLRAEMWVNFALALLSFGAVCLLLEFRSLPRRPVTLVVTGVSLLMFSAVQYENWTWGWELQYYLALFGALGAFVALSRWPGSWVGLTAAGLLATLASYSDGAGLMVWPVGAICVAALWRPCARYLGAWSIAGGVCTLFYFFDLQIPGQLGYVLMHPGETALYALIYLGSWFRGPVYGLAFISLSGVQWLGGDARLASPSLGTIFDALPGPVAGLLLALPVAAGGLGLTLAVGIHWQLVRNRRSDSARWLPPMLLAYFALLCALLTTAGRVNFGVQEALASRYTTLSTLFWIGLLIPAVELAPHWWRGLRLSPRVSRFLLVVVAVALAGTYVSSYAGGVIALRQRALAIRQAAPALLNIETAPDATLLLLYPNAGYLRQQAQTLRELQIGPYAPGWQA